MKEIFPEKVLVGFAALLLSSTAAMAITGNDSAGNGVIGQAHVNLGLTYGNTVAFIDYNNGTATGTFVPSTVPGQLKFLTAAHNVDANNDGVLDGGANALTFHFGAAPGLNGVNATYRVVAQPGQIVLKPNWATSGGAATNDLAVITFSVNDLVVVQGGALPTTAPVNTQSPIGQTGIVLGFGLSGDGTVPLDPNNQNLPVDNQVDGVLKAGYNVAGGVGVPGTGNLPDFGGTVTANSGVVVLVDFDQSINNGQGQAAGTSTFNDPLPPQQQVLEAGTASGDSGSPFLIDSNQDGIYEVAGVLNGGDNPIQGQGVSEFGDISQYAPIFTAENIAFLEQQGIFLGTAYQGVTISGNMVVIDLAAVGNVAANPLGAQALANQINILRRMGDNSLQVVQQRSLRVAQGTSLLGIPGSSTDGTSTFGFGGIGQKNAEVYFEGTLGRNDDTINSAVNGQIGIEFKASETLLLGAAIGTGSRNGDFSDESLSATGYAIGVIDRYALTAALSWSQHDIDSRFGGSRTVSEADLLSVELGAIGRMEYGAVTLSPSLAFRYTRGTISDATITTAGVSTALPDQDFDQYRVEAGITASFVSQRDWGVIVPHVGGRVGYRDSWSDGTVTAGGAGAAAQPFFGLQNNGGVIALVNLANPVAGAAGAATASTDGGSAYGDLFAGVEFQWNEGHSLGFGTSARFGDGGESYGASIRLSIAF